MNEQKIGFWKSYGNFWKKYLKFNDYTSRRGYWWPFLINNIIRWVGSILMLLLLANGLGSIIMDQNANIVLTMVSGLVIGGLVIAFLIAIIIPRLSITCRRYHDAGLSSWWLLATYGVPFLTWIIVFIMINFGKDGLMLIWISIICSILNIVFCALPTKPAAINKYKQ